MNPVSLSLKEARKIALHSQKALSPRGKGRAIDVTRAAIEHLGYIQIDTISVIERAHHHTIWNRNPGYRPSQLDKLQRRCDVFEYWAHAAAYLPIQDYRICLPNMESVKKGNRLWFKADPKLKKKVLERIRAEGPLQSKDFENHGKTKLPMWEWKPAKYALETLFMEGELMVVRREKFQKVYDLRERVLPGHVDTSTPDTRELCGMLIDRYLAANGLGTAAQISYLRKGLKKQVEGVLVDYLEAGKVLACRVGELDYYATPQSLELLSTPLSRSRLKILSPFDNLVIQRKRISELFGFDYQIECYVPEKKRKFGYFCLPVLWNAGLVARLDCKADRKTGVLIIRNLVLEDSLKKQDVFFRSLKKEMDKFALFNGCVSWQPGNTCSKLVRTMLVS